MITYHGDMAVETGFELQSFRRRAPWIVALVGTVALVVLVILPPLVGGRLGALIVAAFSAVCHQLPERTMHVAGMPLAVCSRCVGIYAGLASGVALYAVGRPSEVIAAHAPMALVVALAVPGIDWLAGVAGWWQSGHVIRLATGAVFGYVAGTLMARAVVALNPSAAPHLSEDHGR
jgi:uncharacterized membrane protein